MAARTPARPHPILSQGKWCQWPSTEAISWSPSSCSQRFQDREVQEGVEVQGVLWICSCLQWEAKHQGHPGLKQSQLYEALENHALGERYKALLRQLRLTEVEGWTPPPLGRPERGRRASTALCKWVISLPARQLWIQRPEQHVMPPHPSPGKKWSVRPVPAAEARPVI